MAVSRKILYRKHNYAIVDEVDSVLIDDARTPLIISGPVPKGDDQLFDEFRPRVEMIVKAQRELTTQLLAEASQKWLQVILKSRKRSTTFIDLIKVCQNINL